LILQDDDDSPDPALQNKLYIDLLALCPDGLRHTVRDIKGKLVGFAGRVSTLGSSKAEARPDSYGFHIIKSDLSVLADLALELGDLRFNAIVQYRITLLQGLHTSHGKASSRSGWLTSARSILFKGNSKALDVVQRLNKDCRTNVRMLRSAEDGDSDSDADRAPTKKKQTQPRRDPTHDRDACYHCGASDGHKSDKCPYKRSKGPVAKQRVLDGLPPLACKNK
jgi:hypothetical protein